MDKTYVKLIAGQYKGRKGYVEQTKATKVFRTVMFYSKEGEFPYRTVVHLTDCEVITKAEYLKD
jgi:hypothetical protein